MSTNNLQDKEILIDLGNRIQKKRVEINMTQNDFALKCGISPSTLIRIESGTDSRISNIIRVLDGFGVLENINLLIPPVKPMYTVKGRIKRRAVTKKRSR